MMLDDSLRQSQAKSGAGFAFGGEVGLEDGLAMLLGDAVPVVGDDQLNPAVALMQAKIQCPLFGQSIEGIHDQVRDHPKHVAPNAPRR